MKDKSDEKWLKSIQQRLKKYISSPYWDDISISDTHFNIITHIMNANSIKELSPSINERVTDSIFERIKQEIKRCSKKSNYETKTF